MHQLWIHKERLVPFGQIYFLSTQSNQLESRLTLIAKGLWLANQLETNVALCKQSMTAGGLIISFGYPNGNLLLPPSGFPYTERDTKSQK